MVRKGTKVGQESKMFFFNISSHFSGKIMKLSGHICGITNYVSTKSTPFLWDMTGVIKKMHLKSMSHFGPLSDHSAVDSSQMILPSEKEEISSTFGSSNFDHRVPGGAMTLYLRARRSGDTPGRRPNPKVTSGRSLLKSL